jgi:hypothetical protein
MIELTSRDEVYEAIKVTLKEFGFPPVDKLAELIGCSS